MYFVPTIFLFYLFCCLYVHLHTSMILRTYLFILCLLSAACKSYVCTYDTYFFFFCCLPYVIHTYIHTYMLLDTNGVISSSSRFLFCRCGLLFRFFFVRNRMKKKRRFLSRPPRAGRTSETCTGRGWASAICSRTRREFCLSWPRDGEW